MSLTIRFGHEPASYRCLDTALRAAIRRCLADEVERLLDMVEALDGDPDFENEHGGDIVDERLFGDHSPKTGGGKR